VSLHPGPLTDGTAAFPHPPPRIGRLGEREYDNVVYSCEPGYRPLFLDLRVPAGTAPHPLIVWIHGGGWIYGSRRRLPPHLFENAIHDRVLDAGYAVASIDYRLAREAGFAGMLLDVKAAVRWLRGHAAEFDLDTERVVLWGESAGGHLAVMGAVCTRLDGAPRTGENPEQSEVPTAVVDWYGPTDLTALDEADLGGDSEEVGKTEDRPEVVLRSTSAGWSAADLSATTYARRDVPPIFVAHGTDDRIVPVDQSRALVARLRAAGAPVDYLEVPGADHVWRGAPSVPDIVAASLAFSSQTQGP
jgi:acetyl esterase/lipase